MERVAFTMKLLDGHVEEYKRRHDALWPDLNLLLKQKGISDYSIFLDEKSLTLFGYLKVEHPSSLDELGKEVVMQTWWNYMKDIMETNPDHSPVTHPLREVFYLP